MVLVILYKQYKSYFNEDGYFDCWIQNHFWRFSVGVFQYIGVILHCFVIIYSSCDQKQYTNTDPLKCYQRNIIKNYFKFIAIYVVLWTPYMVVAILDLSKDTVKIPFWVRILCSGFIISTGLANGIIWHTNKGTYQRSKSIINKISPNVLNKNEKRIGINNSRIITFKTNPLSEINTITNITTQTPTKPSDHDPASKIGARSMYNHGDDTPTMMLIENTVNEYKYITSASASQEA